jgi:hypothetical protein
MAMLEREEYIEQAYFFRSLGDQLRQNAPMQEVLSSIREEILSTTNLPMAIDFMLSELKHGGSFSPAMERLKHYFTPFQTFVIREAENEQGRFDLRIALELLQFEARYRADGATPQGMFLYQFEGLCRNRLGYDHGLDAMAGDPIYDDAWQDWIRKLRMKVGIVDLADLIYVRSAYYTVIQARRGDRSETPPALFGDKEGRIALANRHKDPLLLFSALQRQLNYPAVPRPKPVQEEPQNLIPLVLRRVERLETRLRLVEEESRGGIDLSQFYRPPQQP